MMPIMKDFSKERKVIEFRIDDDVFVCPPALPAGTLMRFIAKFNKLQNAADSEEQIALMNDTLAVVLQPESFDLLKIRMEDPHNPVDLDQLNAILEWVMGEYGLRPTQPSSSSPDGQPSQESGTSSTEIISDAASISLNSELTSSLM